MNLKQFPLWTAVVTPLTMEGRVDLQTLTDLIHEQTEAQNGLLILGSTGEGLNLTLAQKKSILEHVISLKPTSPIMVGVGGHQLEETLEWLTYLETLPIHAYLMVTPLYSKPGAQGQYQWFKTLMDKVTKPVMLYNVPGRTAVALSLEAVEKLSAHPQFWAIKEASGSVEKFKEYVKAANGKGVYCGDDALMPDFALSGSCGLVSVASNCWPKETHRYVKECLAKTFDHKTLWTEASNSLFIASNPVPVKTLMHLKGQIKSPVMVSPLSHLDLKESGILKEMDQKIQSWFKGN